MPMQTTDQWGSLLPKGLGNDQEATQATSAMRQSPWYQDWAKKNNLQFEGDQYGNAKLNDNQQQDLYNQAAQHGIGLNNKYDQIDENGNISEAHHKLRNALIAAAIGGAGLTGFGAAGIGPLSGLLGGASAGAGAASTAAGGGSGLLASTPLSAGLFAAPTSIASGAVPAALASTAAASSPLLGLGMALPSTQVGSGFMPALAGSTSSMAGGTGSSMLGGIGSTIGKFLGKGNPQGMADLSSILGSFSSGEKANRVVGSQMIDEYNRAQQQAEAQRNLTESDAMQKLAQTGYLLNGHSGYKPGTIQLNGQSRDLPDFGYGYTAPSEAQKAGALSLQNQLGSRLKPGGTYTPLKPQIDPGLAENIGSYGGAAVGGLGTIMNMMHPDTSGTGFIQNLLRKPAAPTTTDPNLASNLANYMQNIKF